MFRQSNDQRDAADLQQASNELTKRIRKLRWIGLDEEARQLQVSLGDTSCTDVVLAGPCDTD